MFDLSPTGDAKLPGYMWVRGSMAIDTENILEERN